MVFNTKAALQKAVLLLIEIVRSIGCSLKIHRVESALLMESTERCTVPSATWNLIASTRMKLCFIQVMTNRSLGSDTEETFTLRHNARGERPRKSRQENGGISQEMSKL